MNKFIASSTFAVFALAGPAMSQQPLFEKSAPCALTRTNTYNGHSMTSYSSPSWGGGRPPTTMTSAGVIQEPLTASQSVNCAIVPPGLKAQVVATENIPGPPGAPALAYFLYFTFDEKGRVWAIDSRDYPYTHGSTGDGRPTLPEWNTYCLTNNCPRDTVANYGLPSNRLAGQSRIVIMSDENGDGALDSYKVFFTGLALPTSLEIVKNGVIVQVPPNIYYIQKNSLNPDTAAVGTPQIVVNGMGSTSQTYDTHGQPNSLTRGLDNWIYGHTGYNGCGGTGANVTGTGSRSGSCGNGNSYRFKHVSIGSDTSRFEVRSSGSANAHGLGQMEDGQIFKSGATGTPHANHDVRPGVAALDIRDADGGSGNTGSGRLYAATRDRWLWEGNNAASNEIVAGTVTYVSTGSSAVSGYDFYTARLLPQKYWNRFGFACEGASKLCNQDSLVPNGSTWRAVRLPPPNKWPNIFVSTDAWTAPLKVRTGPDGALWVLDWYNYLFLHNPASPQTNAAYRSPLRGKTRVRLYRIVPSDGSTHPVLNLEGATDVQLVQALYNTNFLWRLQAQRLLIERGYNPAVGDLLDSILTYRRQPDAVGVDGPVLHALWTLHGMRRFEIDSARWNPKLRNLLLHPAWTVRRNVPLAMPATGASYASLREMCAVNDVHAHVRLQALENLARIPASGAVIQSVEGLRTGDTYIGGAYTSATTSKVTSETGSVRPASCPAYLDTNSWTITGVAQPINFARTDVRFGIRPQGFDLKAGVDLPSGELVVSDLRGRVVFRSTYNNPAGTWSKASASNLPHPFYFYSFKGNNGSTRNGRIPLSQGY